ncbi:MAG: branched-chain amino acid ABC transporter permease [Anaerolineae bacterium]
MKNKNQSLMQPLQDFYQQYQLEFKYGLIAGIMVLFVGVIGMLESFQNREVIRDFMTLAQILLLGPAFVTGVLIVRRKSENNDALISKLTSALVIGLLTALPTLILVFLNAQVFEDLRSIFVNVNRNWVEVVTFDNDSLLIGSGLVALAMAGLSLSGGIIASLPRKISRAILMALTFTITIGVFGQTVGLILNQLLPEDVLDAIFRRDVLLQEPAMILFGLSLVGAFIWSYGSEPINQQYQAMPKQNQSIVRLIGLGLFSALLLALPFIVGRALSDTAVTIGLFVLMGLGLNIAIGLAGLLDLGYVTNYAVGAYLMAALTSRGPLGLSSEITAWLNSFMPITFGEQFINFWLVLPIAILAAMLTGFLFALPVLKMRGDYLAIATLGFGEIIGKLVISDWFSPVIGGAQGIQFIPKPEFFGTTLSNPEQLYYVVLAACILTLYVSVRLNNSRTGRQWMAVREDEDVAAAMGIDVPRAKLLAFTLSAATGGLAGAIFAAKVGSVFPNSFTVFVSINVLSLIIVGGIGSNPGVFIGALVLIGMPELLREFSDYRFLIYGALLIFMMVNRPEGLWPSKIRQREIRTDLETDPTLKAKQSTSA